MATWTQHCGKAGRSAPLPSLLVRRGPCTEDSEGLGVRRRGGEGMKKER